jgi:hypothetical protein
VEQAGMAAGALQEEAENLSRLVSIFKLDGIDGGTRQPAVAASPAVRRVGAKGGVLIGGPAAR